jgi:transcriptional regulator with XRE-family HTH domain
MMAMKEEAKLTEQLRAAVRRSGKTLGELARATGIHVSALSRFVRGERGVSMEGLDALGECLRLRIVAVGGSRREGKTKKRG